MASTAERTTTPSLLEQLDAALGVKEASEYSEVVHLLVYGPPGVGKTWLAGTALDVPDMCPVLFIDIEGGNKTNRRRKGARTIQVRTYKEISTVYDTVEAAFLTAKKKGEKPPYSTLVIDRVDELANIHKQALGQQAHDENREQSPFLPHQSHYLINQGYIEYIVRKFRDLGVNTIWVAHEKKEQDQLTSKVEVEPAFAKKLAKQIPGYFDVVLRMNTYRGEDGVKRAMLAQPDGKHSAKDRYHVLGEIIENDNCNMPWIWDRIQHAEDSSDLFAAINPPIEAQPKENTDESA